MSPPIGDLMYFPSSNSSRDHIVRYWRSYLEELKACVVETPTWSSPHRWMELWGTQAPTGWQDLVQRKEKLICEIEREFDFPVDATSDEPRGRWMDDLQKRLGPMPS